MKKLTTLFLALAMVLSLAACSNSTQTNTPNTSTPSTPSVPSASTPSTPDASEPAPEDFTFDQPVTVIVPFNAGSATDNQLRLMQSKLEEALGTTLVIINSAGASGTIGTTEYLTNYAADGFTILYALATPVVYQPLKGQTAYTYDDLIAVCRTSSQPMYLIMADSNPMANAKDVLEYIKSNPDTFTYSHVGNGGNGHLAFASFLMGEGLEAVSVPYPGGTADCYTAVMGGEVDAAVYGEADLLAREEAHGVINLGSKSSMPQLAGVPTLADLGYEGYETNNLAGFFYSKGTPAAAVTAFEAAVESVLTDPDFIAEASAAGFEPAFGSGADLDAQAAMAIEKALPVIQSLDG